jgi:hypothetical protein
MNERIRELADEAVTRVALRCEGSMESDKHGEWIRYDDLKKFAELIVQECGVALSPMLRDMVSRGQAVDMIKQHFGVEE